jgi:hypothetical protein
MTYVSLIGVSISLQARRATSLESKEGVWFDVIDMIRRKTGEKSRCQM